MGIQEEYSSNDPDLKNETINIYNLNAQCVYNTCVSWYTVQQPFERTETYIPVPKSVRYSVVKQHTVLQLFK